MKKKNGGIGSAISLGLKKVSGEYFIWFNIDDILTPDAILIMKDYLDKNKEYGLVRPDVYISEEEKPLVPIRRINDNNPEKGNPYLFNNALNEKNFTFGCSMLRTEWFDRINPKRYIYESRQGQNWQILLPMFYYYKSGYIDEPLYYVIEQKESTSRVSDDKKKIQQIEEYENILLRTLEFMEIPEKEKYISQVQLRFAHRLFRWAERNDYVLMKEKYVFLKQHNALSKVEKRIFFNRFKQPEFWLELKHRLLK